MATPASSPILIDAVIYETFDWTPRAPQIYSRAEAERQTGAYDAALTPAIAAWTPVVSSEDSADVEDATRQLVEFDHHAQRKLGTGNPALGPMTAILLRTESASSSQIEQLTTSAKQLALAEIDEGDKANALTVVGNVRAMEAALQLADDISEDSILAMHKALMLHQIGFPPEDVGRFRTEPVWIGKGEAGPRLADFVAPHQGRVPGAIDDLVRFVKRQDVPVLVQVAVAHAQFETIHPFPDGNGRTGRALLQSMLRHGGLTRNVTVPVSAGLLQNTDAYFAALTNYREGNPNDIVTAVTEAVFSALTNGRQLVDELRTISSEWKSAISARRGSTGVGLQELLLKQPVVNAQMVAAELSVSEVAAQTAINKLIDAGILVKTNNRTRGRIWHAPQVLEALDSFAARARRHRH